MATVSLTMIVRNEEANLPGCLASCAGLFDELVIVDTGSTDRTKEIAAAATDKHGQPARVFDFAWCDDFSAARNESLRHATGDWVFWMDADDRLVEQSRSNLSEAFAALDDPNVAYTCNVSTLGEDEPPYAQVRLFSARTGIAWKRMIHECPVPLPDARQRLDVSIYHTGYSSPAARKQKALRNIPILYRQIELLPDDALLHYYMGADLITISMFGKAFEFLTRAHALLNMAENGVPEWYDALLYYLGVASMTLGRADVQAIVEGSLYRLGTPSAIWYLQRLQRFPTSSSVLG